MDWAVAGLIFIIGILVGRITAAVQYALMKPKGKP